EAGANGNDVAVAAHVDRRLGARLHARVALPAQIRLLVPGLAERPVEDHQVVRADVHAGGSVERPAAIPLVRVDIGRHSYDPPTSVRARRSRPEESRAPPGG